VSQRYFHWAIVGISDELAFPKIGHTPLFLEVCHWLMITTTLNHNLLRDCRERRGLKQIELASRAGVSLSTVNRLEGWNFRAAPSTAKRLAVALGVGIGDVFPYLKERVTP
jgi:DNA-binding XRE family transcriptional regulator